MLEEELGAALHYGSNSSNMKEMDFVHQELAKQFQAGHIVVSPLNVVRNLPKLCLSPVGAILQVGRWPRLIFEFTWIGLNEATARGRQKS